MVLLIAAGSVADYFLVLLPNQQKQKIQFDQEQQRAKLNFEERKYRDEQAASAFNGVQLQNCLDTAEGSYAKNWENSCLNSGIDKRTEDCQLLPKIQADSLDDLRSKEKQNCFKQYPQ